MDFEVPSWPAAARPPAAATQAADPGRGAGSVTKVTMRLGAEVISTAPLALAVHQAIPTDSVAGS
jgi:hypothetical protein